MRPMITLLAVLLSCFVAHAQTAEPLPPVTGVIEPKVIPKRAEDGMFHQTWALNSFLDLREDFADARQKGMRFAVIFEQRGCVYCTKMHTDVLAQRYINDYVRENFAILQLDMFGAREVTDFDGRKISEAKLAERWGVMFTPTVVFFKDELPTDKSTWGPPLEVTRMSLGFGAATFYDLFVWVRAKVYERDRNFQRFHLERMAERGKTGVAAD
jgi:thioredoxin-related protein